ncbi:hypothetical protein [Pelosinus propionicus]|nr:hypothetical protein [Pelosinus propionicus]
MNESTPISYTKRRKTTYIIGSDGKRKRKRNRIRNLEVCGKR